MPSKNTTSLGLNQWDASDKPVREDFVRDNTIINDKITQLNSDLNGKVSQYSTPCLEAIELSAATPFIDFHTDRSSSDYTSRIIANVAGILDVTGNLNVAERIKQQGKQVVISENDDVILRNDSGFLMATIGTLDLGGIATCAGHKIKFVWNGDLFRLYVWIDSTELGYIPFAK